MKECIACPFAYSEESEKVQNYGCLPSAGEIVAMAKSEKGIWACHSNENLTCRGLLLHAKEKHIPLNRSLPKLLPSKW